VHLARAGLSGLASSNVALKLQSSIGSSGLERNASENVAKSAKKRERSPRVLGQRAKSPMGSRAYGHRAKSPRGPFLGPTSQVSKRSVSWANEQSLMSSRASGPVYKGLVSWSPRPSSLDARTSKHTRTENNARQVKQFLLTHEFTRTA
jgi:hypothetical protein